MLTVSNDLENLQLTFPSDHGQWHVAKPMARVRQNSVTCLKRMEALKLSHPSFS